MSAAELLCSLIGQLKPRKERERERDSNKIKTKLEALSINNKAINVGPSINIAKVYVYNVFWQLLSHDTIWGRERGVKKHLPNPRKHYIRSVILKKDSETCSICTFVSPFLLFYQKTQNSQYIF